jgi:hypothetical protein
MDIMIDPRDPVEEPDWRWGLFLLLFIIIFFNE